MLHETGFVSDIVGDLAIVQTKNQLACSSCKVVDACGNGILEKYLSGKVFTSEINNRLNAKVGDEVVLAIPKASITKASIIVYFVPLLTFISFALVASLISQSENIIIFISLLGLASGLFVTKFYNRYWLNGELYLPKMVSIVDTGSSAKCSKAMQKHSDRIDINEV